VCVATPAEAADVAVTQRSIERQNREGVELIAVSTLEGAEAAIDRAPGWIGLLDPGDVLADDALARIGACIDAEPLTDLVYTDETVEETNGVRIPFYKPAWSPDRLRCQPYTGRLTLARAALVTELGGLRADLAGAAELDLILRIGERARRVAHVPELLCHRTPTMARDWTAYPRFEDASREVACRVVDEHLRRLGIGAVARPHQTAGGLLRLEPRLNSRPMTSIIVPTGGARRRVRGEDITLVVNCVRSVLERSTYEELEVICVTDRGVDPSTLAQLAALDSDRVRIVEFDGPFDFARKVNRGALAAAGDVLVFLNDDTEVQTPGWLESMLVYGLDPDVGAVGARLLFEDGSIQHAGVVGVGGNPGHAYYGWPRETLGHGGNALVPGDFLAVTGACLMTRRECFEQVGGMSAWFPSNYNDLDYCMKLGMLGYRVVATPDAVLDHYESSSRDGEVASPELELIRRRWGRWLRDDPFYGPNFPSGIADFVPA